MRKLQWASWLDLLPPLYQSSRRHRDAPLLSLPGWKSRWVPAHRLLQVSPAAKIFTTCWLLPTKRWRLLPLLAWILIHFLLLRLPLPLPHLLLKIACSSGLSKSLLRLLLVLLVQSSESSASCSRRLWNKRMKRKFTCRTVSTIIHLFIYLYCF